MKCWARVPICWWGQISLLSLEVDFRTFLNYIKKELTFQSLSSWMIEKAIMIEGDGKKLPKMSGNIFF